MSHSIYVFSPKLPVLLQGVCNDVMARVESRGLSYASNFPVVASYLKAHDAAEAHLADADLDPEIEGRLGEAKGIMEIESPLAFAATQAEQAVLVATLRELSGSVVEDDGTLHRVEDYLLRFSGKEGANMLSSPETPRPVAAKSPAPRPPAAKASPKAPAAKASPKPPAPKVRRPPPRADDDEAFAVQVLRELVRRDLLLVANEASYGSLASDLCKDLEGWSSKAGDLAEWLVDRPEVTDLFATDAEIREVVKAVS